MVVATMLFSVSSAFAKPEKAGPEVPDLLAPPRGYFLRLVHDEQVGEKAAKALVIFTVEKGKPLASPAQ